MVTQDTRNNTQFPLTIYGRTSLSLRVSNRDFCFDLWYTCAHIFKKYKTGNLIMKESYTYIYIHFQDNETYKYNILNPKIGMLIQGG